MTTTTVTVEANQSDREQARRAIVCRSASRALLIALALSMFGAATTWPSASSRLAMTGRGGRGALRHRRAARTAPRERRGPRHRARRARRSCWSSRPSGAACPPSSVSPLPSSGTPASAPAPDRACRWQGLVLGALTVVVYAGDLHRRLHERARNRLTRSAACQTFAMSQYPPQPPYSRPPQDHPQTTTILVLGICGLVLCQVLGPFAWSMGNRPLREIDCVGRSAGRPGDRERRPHPGDRGDDPAGTRHPVVLLFVVVLASAWPAAVVR